jgi:hypothetical protein
LKEKHGQGRKSEEEVAVGESKAELEEHTVEELKDIADNEGADLGGATVKADIVKAIQKNRKSKK